MTKKFEEGLKLVKKRILMLAEYTLLSSKLCMEYIKDKDKEKLEIIYETEKESDMLNLEIQENCLNLIALFQPVARDLRFISAIMDISYCFERICDLNERIVTLVKNLKLDEDDIFYLSTMLLNVNEILKKSKNMIEEYSTNSVIHACEEEDDIIDILDEEMRENLKKKISQNPEKIQNLDLIQVSYLIERAGDIACKIVSRVLYIIKGERIHIK